MAVKPYGVHNLASIDVRPKGPARYSFKCACGMAGGAVATAAAAERQHALHAASDLPKLFDRNKVGTALAVMQTALELCSGQPLPDLVAAQVKGAMDWGRVALAEVSKGG